MDYLKRMFGLEGTVAVITGGGGVLAGAMAEALVHAGATAVLWGRSKNTPIEEAVSALKAKTGSGASVFGVTTDTGSEEEVMRALSETESLAGAPRLLVNGVGGNLGKCAFVDIDMETFDKVLHLNLAAGLVIPTKAFAAYWIGKGIQGTIVNIASMAAHIPLSGTWAYGAAKAGVVNLTMASAKEFAPYGIRVNALSPGFFIGKQNKALLIDENTGSLTERGKAVIAHTPFGRFGEAGELAGALLFLANPNASGFVTGVTIPVDGGYLIQNI